jgi:TFIIF-interacting CTD phosphatase-like protein
MPIENIILDLDETLLSSVTLQDISEIPHGVFQKRSKTLSFENMDDYYLVFKRPHLQEFLSFIFKNFNVSVWSAASKDYVMFIIENILLKDDKRRQVPNRKLDYVLFSHHCEISELLYGSPKDLSFFWEFIKDYNYNPTNTLIVDDLDDVVKVQNCNAIQIANFNFTDNISTYDTHLLHIIDKLKILKSAPTNSCPVKMT